MAQLEYNTEVILPGVEYRLAEKYDEVMKRVYGALKQYNEFKGNGLAEFAAPGGKKVTLSVLNIQSVEEID
jgi:hypothetical protein